MTTTIRNIFSVCAIALCAFAVLPAFAWAAYQIEEIPGDEIVGDFVVGPGKFEIDVRPGEQKTVEMIVTNRMGDTRTFSFGIEDVKGSTDPRETVVLLGTERGPYSLKDYVHIPEMTFDLKHGERARIPITVKVPEDAEPGGFYGSVLVSTNSRPSEGAEENTGARSGSVIVSRIGTLFFVRVPGEAMSEGKLVDFSTIPDNGIFKSGPIKLQLLFENAGSIHLNPYGDVRIRNIFGQEVGEVIAEPWFALPGSLRFREVSWDRKHLFGYYTAEAQINRGYDDVVDTMSTSFVVIPWELIAGVLAALIVCFFLIRLIGRSFEIKRKS